MTLSTSHPMARQRWATLVILVAIGLLVAGVMSTLAVNATGAFELDGNAVTDHTGTAAPDDFDRVCYDVTFKAAKTAGKTDAEAATAASTNCTATSGTNNAVATSWVDAEVSPTIYTGGGSKDPSDISSWLWKAKDTVPDKDTLRHAFAARYSMDSKATCPGPAGDTSGATKCEVIFFGMDRFANDGDAQLGFWFFQNEIGLTNTSSQGGFKFSGVHKNGDLLLISDFSNGGTTATISAYFWDSTCTKAANNDPQAGQCAAANLRLQAKSDDANCAHTPADAKFCGIVNPNGTETAPWPYVDKRGSSGTYLQGEYYEGGVNLSGLGIGSECFSSIAAESRASTSPTSVLKDFVLGKFGECTSGTVTTPQTGTSSSDAAPITGDVSIGTSARVSVMDKAVITVNGSSGTFGGTVKFYLCGPLALTSTGNCASGGVQIGATAGETVSGSNGTATVFSAPATLTSTGRYCWRAVYGGDSAKTVPGSSDPKSASDTSVSECFKVVPVTPTLSTTAVDGTGTAVSVVDFGQPLYDKASLTGTAKQPGTDGKTGSLTIDATAGSQLDAGGSIVFKLYGPAASSTPTTTECNTLAAGFSSAGITVNVSGNGTYPSANPSTVTFTPSAPGYYFWKAAYGGNSPNTTAAPLDSNGAATQHNADCTVTAERVQVRQIPTELRSNMSWYPNDTAQIKSSASGDSILAGGTVDFFLYDSATCSGTLRYNERVTLASGDISGGIATVSTKNYQGGNGTAVSGTWSAFKITTLLTDAANTTVNYSWKIVYTPAAGDTAHLGRQSACNAASPVSIEKFGITYTNDNSGGTQP